jgi:hypothetical protein
MHYFFFGGVAVTVAALLLGCGDDTVTSGSGAAGGNGGDAGGGAQGGDGSGGNGGGGSGGGGCEMLSDDELQSLEFGTFLGFYQAQPGESVDIDLGVIECCYMFTPVNVCATYSVEGDAGASIDAASGVLDIGPAVPSGTELVVTADIQSGAATRTVSVFVYDPAENPLVGGWTETAQIDCATSMESPPPTPMQELAFWANGTFWATWMPFELYVDYTGTYTFDLATGELVMTPNPGGNYVPPDVDGTGTFSIEGTDLVLQDMWLGTPQGSNDPPACGHRLE